MNNTQKQIHLFHLHKYLVINLLFWLWDVKKPVVLESIVFSLCGQIADSYIYTPPINNAHWDTFKDSPFIRYVPYPFHGECSECVLLRMQIEASGIDIDEQGSNQ